MPFTSKSNLVCFLGIVTFKVNCKNNSLTLADACKSNDGNKRSAEDMDSDSDNFYQSRS